MWREISWCNRLLMLNRLVQTLFIGHIWSTEPSNPVEGWKHNNLSHPHRTGHFPDAVNSHCWRLAVVRSWRHPDANTSTVHIWPHSLHHHFTQLYWNARKKSLFSFMLDCFNLLADIHCENCISHTDPRPVQLTLLFQKGYRCQRAHRQTHAHAGAKLLSLFWSCGW